MKDILKSYIGWLLILSALGFYVYGIGHAIDLSWGDKEISEKAYAEALRSTINAIQALLMTNLGIILGIAIAKPQSALARNVLFNTRNTLVAQGLKNPLETREQIQLLALVLYVLSLIACLIVWIKNDFSTEVKDVVSVIPQSGQMFIGVVLAYLTAVFSNPDPAPVQSPPPLPK